MLPDIVRKRGAFGRFRADIVLFRDRFARFRKDIVRYRSKSCESGRPGDWPAPSPGMTLPISPELYH
jgi:hypothetical protein